MHHNTEFIALLTSFDPGITYSVCTWRLPLKEATDTLFVLHWFMVLFFFLFRMGRKFRLSVHRKNEERKRYKVTSLTVSIPLELVTVTTPPCQQERRTTAVYGVPSPCSKLSLSVSWPPTVYTECPARSLCDLRRQTKVAGVLPPGT